MELMPKANEVCGTRTASLGKFQYELSEPLDTTSGAGKTLVLSQEIRCEAGDGVTTSSAESNGPGSHLFAGLKILNHVDRLDFSNKL